MHERIPIYTTSKKEHCRLGHTLSLTPYFSELRDELFQQKKKHAKDFIERLELAILIAVRIADKDAGDLFILNANYKNKLCNVCQSLIQNNNQGEFSTYFRAEKVKRSCEYSSALGFLLKWTHEKSDQAEKLGPAEWLSGPLLLCTECLATMSWYENQVYWESIKTAIANKDYQQLPLIFSLYSSLEKSLRLAESFGSQVASLLRNPYTTPEHLAEVKRFISNSCDVIETIGKQISTFGLDNPNHSKEELILQQNISKHCTYISTELNYLFAINKAKPDNSEPTVSFEVVESYNTRGIINYIWNGLMFLTCGCGYYQV